MVHTVFTHPDRPTDRHLVHVLVPVENSDGFPKRIHTDRTHPQRTRTRTRGTHTPPDAKPLHRGKFGPLQALLVQYGVFTQPGPTTPRSVRVRPMPLDPAELASLRAIVAPVHANLLSLIDARPKQPGFVPGRELPALYLSTFGEALSPEKLTGQTELKSMLNRRNIFPSIGVRGSENKGGWLIYRVVAPVSEPGTCPPELVTIQDNIVEMLHRAAHPTAPGAVARHSLNAGKLLDDYGRIYRRRFNFRDFGFLSVRALIEACPKLTVRFTGRARKGHGVEHALEPTKHMDKMRVVMKCDSDQSTGGSKRPRDTPEGVPTISASTSDIESATATASETTAAGGGDKTESKEEKAARKAAKRARKAEDAGLTIEEMEAAKAEAKEKRKLKKAAGKEKKAKWLAGER